MKLKYNKKSKIRVLYPVDLKAEYGTTYETDDKEVQDALKDIGFIEVDKPKKKDGDK